MLLKCELTLQYFFLPDMSEKHIYYSRKYLEHKCRHFSGLLLQGCLLSLTTIAQSYVTLAPMCTLILDSEHSLKDNYQ